MTLTLPVLRAYISMISYISDQQMRVAPYAILAILALLLSLSSQFECSLYEPLYAQIKSDLAPFKEGITPSMIETVKRLNLVCPIIIKSGQAYPGQNCQVPFVHQWFKCRLDDLNLPDMQFVINGIDEPRVLKHHCNTSQVRWNDDCFCEKGYQKPNHGIFISPSVWQPLFSPFPIFSSGTIPACFYDIIFPSVFHITEYNIAPSIPWSEKQFKVFWRGGSTGGNLGRGIHFSKFHRHRMVELCRQIEDCDAMFSSYERTNEEMKAMEQYYGPREYVRMRRQASYKVIIDIDGYTYSQRLTQLMKMGVAILKIKVFEDIGSILPQPWQHYIPADISLDDFQQKIKWAKDNDEKIQKIAERAKDLADRHFNIATYKCYIKILLTEYHKLLRPEHNP